MQCGCKGMASSGGVGLPASYESRSFTIAGNASVFVDANVRLVAVLTLTGADDFQIRVNDGQLGLAFESWQFRALDPAGVRSLELVNTAGSPITVTLALARSADLIDGRFALPGALSVSLTGATLTSTADASVGATTTAQVLAANSLRREAIIQNLDPASAVRIGDGSVGAARGLRLAAGDSITLTTSAAISCHNPTGAAVALALLEVAA